VSANIELIINGKVIHVSPGTTILEAAGQAGIEIPTLCYLEDLTAYGLCRICVVEVEGMRGLQAACVTQAQPGMVVDTKSENVIRARRTILEMLAASVDLSESPELQNLLEEYQARPDRFAEAERRDPTPLDDNPVYIRDYSKCVLCWRCVQVCAEDVQYNYAINFSGRGFHTSIDTFFKKPLPLTRCVFCGNCVGVCPTGALKAKREALLEQGMSSEEVFELTRQTGRGMQSRIGPRLFES
jgi:NADH dehydrogenase/NADH:ubiquinone oxidoreductase subunit G